MNHKSQVSYEPLYSVIIPVFNTEKYLRCCIDSVIAQTTTENYEVILIDDGSPDNSGLICDEYAEKYSNCRVIHLENGGVSHARNIGIQEAKGTYILFLDSDDLWKPDLLSAIGPILREKFPDMCVFLGEIFTEQGESRVLGPSVMPENESGFEYLKRVFMSNSIPLTGVWLVAFKTDFIRKNNVFFPEKQVVSEDFDFNMQCFTYAEMISGVPQVFYRYRINPFSVTHTPSPEKVMMNISSKEKWYRRYPVSSLANLYVGAGIGGIISIKNRKDCKDIIQVMKKNRDILKNVTGYLRMASCLMRVFGIYFGAWIWTWLRHMKQAIQKLLKG